MAKKKLKSVVFIIISFFSGSFLYAAQEITLAGDANSYAEFLNKFSLQNNKEIIPSGLCLPTSVNHQKNSVNKLEFQEGHVDSLHHSHVRYNQSYHGLPVWGEQIIYHIGLSKKMTVSGTLLDNIEEDIPNINEGIPISQAKKIVSAKDITLDKITAQKIIFYDESISTKAILAYRISYSAAGPSLPVYIIDANTGVILKQSDEYTTMSS